MAEKVNILLGIVAAIFAVLALVAFLNPVTVTDVKYVDKPVLVPVSVPVELNSSLQDAAATKILENDNFETLALNLAIADLEAKGYKDLFNAMDDNSNISIDEKGDISKVVIKDSDVSSVDVDEQDADVELELKVYYEDLSGDDVKSYITVDYSIVDGEVEDVVYTF